MFSMGDMFNPGHSIAVCLLSVPCFKHGAMLQISIDLLRIVDELTCTQIDKMNVMNAPNIWIPQNE